MTNREHIDHLLQNLRELESLAAGMREAEIYPVSFFSRAFRLSHHLIEELQSLEASQIDVLQKQMEEHRKLIEAIPRHESAIERPLPETPSSLCYPEKKIAPQETGQPDSPVIPDPQTIEKPVEKVTGKPSERLAESIAIQAVPGVFITEKPAVSLNEILEKRQLSDFRKALSLNDRFRFRRELFGGDETRMNETLGKMNEMSSYEEALDYLHNELNWNIEDAAVADFLQLLEKRFS